MSEINLFEKEVEKKYKELKDHLTFYVLKPKNGYHIFLNDLEFIYARYKDAVGAVNLLSTKYDELANQIVNGNEPTSTGSINIKL